jgi:NTP pyrophosphatase (non-canonical NTP hydrolase)
VNLIEYQQRARATARVDWASTDGRQVPVLGLVGEFGSIASEIKKSIRDGKAYTVAANAFSEEFGDMIWYLATLASRCGVELSDLTDQSTLSYTSPDRYTALVELAASTGRAAAAVQAHLVDRSNDSELRQAFSNTLNALRSALEAEGLDLGEVLTANLVKVEGTWNPIASAAPSFDTGYPDYEQLPRNIAITFLQHGKGSRLEVLLRVNGLTIGDRLTDNAKDADGYRFHDAFHLAYAAVLGWSPVVRAIFRCKRKSNSQVDEVQDGARAAIIEEAVAQLVFDYASDHSWFEGLDRIDHDLLKHIARMVRHLEVSSCTPAEWQHAILVGHRAFRALRKHEQGTLELDANRRSLEFRL